MLAGSSSPQLTSFAQFLKEDEERFYETFPGAKAAKEAAGAARLDPAPTQYGQAWSTQQLGEEYGAFQGNLVFYYNECPPPPAPSAECFSEQAPISQPAAQPCIDPAHSTQPQLSYVPSFSNQPYDHRRPDITNQHDADSLYTIGDSVPSADVNQDYAPVPVAPFSDSSLQRHNVAPSPLDPPSPFHSQVQQQPQQIVHYTGSNSSLQPAVTAVETPPADYLSSPESPQSIYSPVDTANSHHHPFSADPAGGAEPVSIGPSQPISAPSPNPQQQTFLKTEMPIPIPHIPVPEDSPSPPSPSSFTSTLTMRKRRRTDSDDQPQPPEAGRSYVYKIPLPKPHHTPAPKVPKRRPSSPQSNEKKNLALACFFCRGRKIACGPYDPNSSDRTCGSLKCEYPTESRRGMRKKKGSVVEGSGDQDLGALGSGSETQPQALP
ncbi:hypothetical protein V5O48_003384 [Marasmius crinis-equi]|uniref:Zn(2)-C6 fungal-type domain-containing protein n=1 Tax=Marasmius crinis-equi TaxID=585013 RepID=A0ABR3FT08_9AGAR